MDAEQALTLRCVDHADDRPGNLCGIGVCRGELGEPGRDVIHQACIASVVGGGDVGVVGVARVGEVLGAGGERARHDDRGVDAEAGEFGDVADREESSAALAAN